MSLGRESISRGKHSRYKATEVRMHFLHGFSYAYNDYYTMTAVMLRSAVTFIHGVDITQLDFYLLSHI